MLHHGQTRHVPVCCLAWIKTRALCQRLNYVPFLGNLMALQSLPSLYAKTAPKATLKSWELLERLLESASCKETRGSHITPKAVWNACPWLAWGRRDNRLDFWARGKRHNCCFMRVTLRVITANSKLARDVGRKAGMVTIAMLMAKLPPWRWPQHVDESGCTWHAEFTHRCWGGPGCLGVPCSCPLPLGSSWGCRMFYCKWKLPDDLVELCLQLPTQSKRLSPLNSPSALVRPGRVTQFWKALPVQRSCALLLLVCWLSQP